MTETQPSLSRVEFEALKSKLITSSKSYTKPIRIYCDVDGVVKPNQPVTREEFETRFPNAEMIDVIPPFTGWKETIILEKEMFWWDSEVGARLAALSHSPYVDFVWLTDWRVSAPHALDKLLGINSVGYLDWQRKFSDYNQTFKRHAILEEQEESPSKFIWIDDRANKVIGGAPHIFMHEKYDYDLEFDDETGDLIGDIADAFDELIPQSQFLNVVTDANAGLTLADLDHIEKWVADNIS